MPPLVVAADVVGSACATAERDRCRRAAERSDEDELREGGDTVARRGVLASWRRKSVEAILVAGESYVVVVVFDVVGAKRTVLIRRRRKLRKWQVILTVS